MKKKLITVSVFAVFMLAAVLQAWADAAVIDFHTTNRVDSTITIANPPTNGYSGSGTGTNTGGYIYVGNDAELGIEVRGTFVSTNTTDLLKVTLVRASLSGGSPIGSDFDEDFVAGGGSFWSFAVPYITTGTTAAPVTNTVVWHTNVPTLFMRSATHIGVGNLTNSALVGAGLPFSQNTNVTVKAIRKIIPTTYP